jgi:hypothetical protein
MHALFVVYSDANNEHTVHTCDVLHRGNSHWTRYGMPNAAFIVPLHGSTWPMLSKRRRMPKCGNLTRRTKWNIWKHWKVTTQTRQTIHIRLPCPRGFNPKGKPR